MFYEHDMGAGGWAFVVLANIVIWGLEEHQRPRAGLGQPTSAQAIRSSGAVAARPT